MVGNPHTEEELLDILWRRGIKLLEQKEPAEALKYLLHIATRQPDNVKCLNKIGIAYAELEELDKAEQFFQQTVRLNPKFAQGHSNIGNIYFARREYERAIAKYKLALSINPSYHIAQRNMAAALRKTGRIAEAVRQLKASDRTHRDVQIKKLKDSEQEERDHRGKRRLGCLTLMICLLMIIAVATLVVA